MVIYMESNRYTKHSKRRRLNYKRLFLLILIVALLVAVIVKLVNKGKKTNEENPPVSSDFSSVESGVSSEPQPVSYEERVGKEYKIDITPYLKYIDVKTDEFVFLVNPANPLGKDYVPEDLEDCGHTRKDGRAVQKLRTNAAKALQAFLAEGKEYGVTNVTVTSAYRSYAYQNSLFNQYFERDWKTGKYATREECERNVLTYSTKPGTSEHQSGLCLDMHNLPAADQAFANTTEAKWLAENCYRFGFILRYPKDKRDITKIIYEPWHFRFVGREAATEMYEKGLCLEEYIELKNQ